MSTRKRVNLSMDRQTYARIHSLAEDYKFRSVCEVIMTMVHVMIGCIAANEQRRLSLPDDDRAFIREMFDGLASDQQTPDNDLTLAKKKHR